MKELSPLENACFRIGALLMLVGAAIFIMYPTAGMYVYGVGALMFTLMQIRAEYLGRAITMIRLRRQQLLACCCFVLALSKSCREILLLTRAASMAGLLTLLKVLCQCLKKCAMAESF